MNMSYLEDYPHRQVRVSPEMTEIDKTSSLIRVIRQRVGNAYRAGLVRNTTSATDAYQKGLTTFLFPNATEVVPWDRIAVAIYSQIQEKVLKMGTHLLDEALNQGAKSK